MQLRVLNSFFALALGTSAFAQTKDGGQDWNRRLFLVQSLHQVGNYREALAGMERLASESQGFALEDPRRSLALHNLGVLLHDVGRYRESAKALSAAAFIHRETSGPHSPELAATLNQLALAHVEMGEYTKAEGVLRSVSETLGPQGGTGNREYWRMVLMHARILMNIGRLNAAEERIRTALTGVEGSAVRLIPEMIFLRNQLGYTLCQDGRWAEAEREFRRVVEESRQTWGGNHVNTAKALTNLACAVRENGRPGEAEALAAEAAQTLMVRVGDEHPAYAAALVEHAAALDAQKRSREAKPLRKRAEAILDRLKDTNLMGGGIDLRMATLKMGSKKQR